MVVTVGSSAGLAPETPVVCVWLPPVFLNRNTGTVRHYFVLSRNFIPHQGAPPRRARSRQAPRSCGETKSLPARKVTLLMKRLRFLCACVRNAFVWL